jgi:hypothetical protein
MHISSVKITKNMKMNTGRFKTSRVKDLRSIHRELLFFLNLFCCFIRFREKHRTHHMTYVDQSTVNTGQVEYEIAQEREVKEENRANMKTSYQK